MNGTDYGMFIVVLLQVNMVTGYDIYGAFQPDTIKGFKGKDGKDYMITANEGDAKVQ